MNRHHGTQIPLVQQGPCNWLYFLIFSPCCSLRVGKILTSTNCVAGMTDDLPTPCRPVHHLAHSQSSSFPSLVGLHLSILFSVVLSSFSPGISVLNTFLSIVFFISPHHMPLPVRHSLSDLLGSLRHSRCPS